MAINSDAALGDQDGAVTFVGAGTLQALAPLTLSATRVITTPASDPNNPTVPPPAVTIDAISAGPSTSIREARNLFCGGTASSVLGRLVNNAVESIKMGEHSNADCP